MCRLFILKPFNLVYNSRILYDAPPPMVLKLSTVTTIMLRLHLAIGQGATLCIQMLANTSMIQQYKHVLEFKACSISINVQFN
jgi:hypothetical protein